MLMMWNSMCHLPCGRFPAIAASGMNTPVEHHVVRSGAAHAHRLPGRRDRHALALQRHSEMQHGRPVRRVVIDGAGHQQVADRRAAGEGLPRGHAKAALDLLHRAGALQPVGAAARNQLQLLGRDALQQSVGRRALVLPAPRRDRDDMAVHRAASAVEPQAAPSDSDALRKSRRCWRRRRRARPAPAR